MGIIDYDDWLLVAGVIRAKNSIRMSELCAQSGVVSVYTRRIVDNLKTEGLINTFKINIATIIIENNGLTIKNVKKCYDTYMKKYHR